MTRRFSLAGRLSRVLAVCVAFALIVMMVASTFLMRSWMLTNVDSELHRLSQRAGEDLDFGELDAEDGFTHGGEDPQSAGPEAGRAERSEPGGHSGPPGPGFGGPGVADGTLQYVSEGGRAAGAIITDFRVRALDDEALVALSAVPADGHVRSVHLKRWGTFRVRAQSFEGKTVLVGRQSDRVDGVIWMLAAVEAGLFLLVTISAAFLGRAWVRRELRPLGVVREKATAIAGRDLAEDTRDLMRVGEEARRGPIEVAEVAGAFNAMVDAVEDGMERRARNEAKLRQFIADASHELRTPLASVQGYAQLALRHIDEASRTQALERILSEGERMASLVEQMLTLARLDGDRELACDSVDVVPLVLDALSDAHVLAPDHVWEAGPMSEATVLGDEAALRQILTNLLTNARVHTPAGTRIVVSLTRVAPTSAAGEDDADTEGRPASSMITLRVADDGPGIPAHIRGRVFDRFVRADSSRTRDGRGSTGLGMSIVESLAHAMGGCVRLADCERGTVIDVTLPAA